jgi:hypothetical protein
MDSSSMSSIVLEPARFSAWLQREVDARPLELFRRVFAAIWLVYDACDLALNGTALCASWLLTALNGAPLGLQLNQVALIVCQLGLIVGWRVSELALAACALRMFEWWQYFRVNDFLYYAVTAAWLVFAVPVRDHEGRARMPAWVQRGLLVQTGWIYLASALLKLNPAFVSGEHFFVRHGYQLTVMQWPYPALLKPWLLSLRVNAGLAWLTVCSEATLGLLLVLRRGRYVALALAIGVHGFAALDMNVFFFGASLLAQVALLFPMSAPAAREA